LKLLEKADSETVELRHKKEEIEKENMNLKLNLNATKDVIDDLRLDSARLREEITN